MRRTRGAHRRPCRVKTRILSIAATTSVAALAVYEIWSGQSSPTLHESANVVYTSQFHPAPEVVRALPVHVPTTPAPTNTLAQARVYHVTPKVVYTPEAPASPRASISTAPPATPAPVYHANPGSYGCASLESLWESQGGSSSHAFMAAEIAMAESGGNPNAISPTNDYGLWQINASNAPGQEMLNPEANAREAIALSHDGTDWYPWTTYTSGAYGGKC
jgi:hypothetical protein